jgi:transcription elongation GreA/GreB family factor
MLNACLFKQQLIIADFEHEVKNLRTEITRHDDIASQEHRSTPERNEMLVRMEHELMFLKNELTTLESIDEEKPCDEVEIGAVVVTDQRIFFICTSVDIVEVNGQSFFGISTKAPIYHSMKGKKEGDCFEFSGVRYLVLDVY